MDDISRRTFFKQASAVAAAAGAAAVVPAGIAGAAPIGGASTKPLTADEVSRSEPILAHLTDAGRGRITLFVGTREIEIEDAVVAARIVRAAR